VKKLAIQWIQRRFSRGSAACRAGRLCLLGVPFLTSRGCAAVLLSTLVFTIYSATTGVPKRVPGPAGVGVRRDEIDHIPRFGWSKSGLPRTIRSDIVGRQQVAIALIAASVEVLKKY
jgi:hypothetical protein